MTDNVIGKASIKAVFESIVKTYLKNGGSYEDLSEIFEEISDAQAES